MPVNVFGELKVRIEFPLFFLFLAFMFSDSVKTNLIIFRTCYVTLGYSKNECALLGSQNPDNQTASLEKIVEPYASVIGMLNTLVEGFCSAIACLFVGPWSDRFGRKPILIIPLIGYLIFYLLSAIFAALENISPWYSVICMIPVCLTGGFSTYLAGIFCHVTDSTSEKNRGMKMSFVEAALYSGIFLGTMSSSYLFTAVGYVGVSLLGAVCCCFSLLFTIFFIQETLLNREHEGRYNNLFNLRNIRDMIKIIFKRRGNYARCTLLCCILVMTLSVIITMGNGAVTFLFLREKFHWSLKKYTLFAALANVCYVFGAVFGVYFLHKLLKVPETILILTSLISSLDGTLLMGLAQNEWTIYTIPFAKSLEGVFGPMLRSLVSKILLKEELGKVFSVLTACQFFFGIVGSPLYTLIYNKTISTDVGFFNFVTAGIIIFEICLATGIVIMRTLKVGPYSTLINEHNEERQAGVDQINT